MSEQEIFIFGIIIILLPLFGFALTVHEFIKMGEHPEHYRRKTKPSRIKRSKPTTK